MAPLEKESGKTPCDTNSKFNIPHSTLTKRNKVSFRHIYFLIAFFKPRVDVLADIDPRLSGLRPCKSFRLGALPFRRRSPAYPGWEMEKWKIENSPIALNLTFNITPHPPPIQHSHSTSPPPSPNPTFTFNITTTLPQPNIHIQHYPFPGMAVNA